MKVPQMLEKLEATMSVRQQMLLSCACLRRANATWEDSKMEKEIRICERLADGEIVWEELRVDRGDSGITSIFTSTRDPFMMAYNRLFLQYREDEDGLESPFVRATNTQFLVIELLARAMHTSSVFIERVSRHILGSTLHLPSPPHCVEMAREIYDDRNKNGTLKWLKLGLLADALTDAGLEVVEFENGFGPHPALHSLRETSEKYRGYWVIDRLLGKA